MTPAVMVMDRLVTESVVLVQTDPCLLLMAARVPVTTLLVLPRVVLTTWVCLDLVLPWVLRMTLVVR